MKIVLASSNKDKLKEIKELLNQEDILSFSEIIEPFEIVEDGNSFKENALIKAKAVYEKLKNRDDYIVLSSHDSGISVVYTRGRARYLQC